MTIDVRYELANDELDDLVVLYEEYEWWADRDRAAFGRAAFGRAVAETDALVVLADETGDFLAAARVITDFIYYATVYDVIVAEDVRGEGVGRTLMEAVVDHPDLQDLPRLNLFCRPGLEPFYEACGFRRSEMRAPIPELDGEEKSIHRMVYERAGQQ